MSKSKSKNSPVGLTGEIVVLPKAKRFVYPPAAMKAIRRGKKDEVLQELVWRDRRKSELEGKTLKSLNKILEKFHKEAEKVKDPVRNRIYYVLEKGNKKDVINLLLALEKKQIKKFDEEIPVVEEEIFDYVNVPVPDPEIAKLLGEPTTRKELQKMTVETKIIPGVEFEDVDEIVYYKPTGRRDTETGTGLINIPYDAPLKIREVGTKYKIQVGGPITRKPTIGLSPTQVYAKDLQNMTLEELAEVVYSNQIALNDDDVNDLLTLYLDKTDLKNPEDEILYIENKLEEVKAEISDFKADDFQRDEKIQEREILEERLQHLKKNLDWEGKISKKVKKAYEEKVEELDKEISKLRKEIHKKKKLSSVKKDVIKTILNKKEEMQGKIRPTTPVKEKRRVVENPFNKKYPKFTRVKFKTREGEDAEGVVMNFTKLGVDVSVQQGPRKESKIYKVAYANKSLKVVKKKKASDEQKYIEFDYEITLEELKKEPVTKTLRNMVKMLYEVTLGIQKLAIDEKPGADSAPWEDKYMYAAFAPMTWEEFFRARYERWSLGLFARDAEIDTEKLKAKAKRIAKKERDINVLLDQIGDILDRTDETTAEDYYFALNKEELTVLEAYLAKELGKQGSEMKNMKGRDLSLLIQNAIQEYLKNIPKSEENIYKNLVSLYTRNAFRKYMKEVDDDEHLEMFKKMFEKDIKTDYEKYKKEYGSPKHKKEAEEAVKEAGKSLNDEMREGISIFEDICYNTSNGTMESYLKHVLMPYIFLQGPLAKNATFFRSKVKSGDFKIDSLASANLAYYLPEFSAPNINNPTLVEGNTKKSLKMAIGIISSLLNIQIETVLDLYISILNPTKRRENRKTFERSSQLLEPLRKSMKDVRTLCMQNSGTGQRPVIRDGKYVHKLVGKGKTKREILMMEDIPEEDVVLCYDAKDKKFRCFDSQEVLRDITLAKKGSKPIEKSTGYVYPSDFIKRVKGRSKNVKIPGKLVEDEADAKTVTPKFKPDVSPLKIKRKRLVPLHVPSKKREKEGFEDVDKMLLVGEAFDMITLFFTTFDFEGADGLREIPITKNVKTSSANVHVISFDATEASSDIAKKLQKVYDKIKYEGMLYLIGTGDIPKKDQTKINAKIKNLELPVQHIFYTRSYAEEDLNDALINVVIDVEGSDVLKIEESPPEWAYRADTPRLERKLRKEAAKKKQKEEERLEKARKLAKTKKVKKQKKDIEEDDSEIEISFEEEEPTPKKLTKTEKRALRKRKEAKEAEPLLRAALIGDAKEVEKLKEDVDGYKVVEIYKYIQEAGGDAQVLKILRNDPRVLEIALDGDTVALRYLLEKSNESKFDPLFIYKIAEARKAEEPVKKILREYPSVKDMLFMEYRERKARDEKRKGKK